MDGFIQLCLSIFFGPVGGSEGAKKGEGVVADVIFSFPKPKTREMNWSETAISVKGVTFFFLAYFFFVLFVEHRGEVSVGNHVTAHVSDGWLVVN